MRLIRLMSLRSTRCTEHSSKIDDRSPCTTSSSALASLLCTATLLSPYSSLLHSIHLRRPHAQLDNRITSARADGHNTVLPPTTSAQPLPSLTIALTTNNTAESKPAFPSAAMQAADRQRRVASFLVSPATSSLLVSRLHSSRRH